MFDLLKKFIADTAERSNGALAFDETDDRLAIAALLIHVAKVDGRMDAQERVRLHEIIEARFGLNDAQTTQLIEHAEQSDNEAVDFFHFTNVLKRSLDDDGRRRIIAMMWDVVFADGAVTEFEENVVWRIAELLGVSTRDRVLLRQKAADAPPDAVPAGPWSGARQQTDGRRLNDARSGPHHWSLHGDRSGSRPGLRPPWP